MPRRLPSLKALVAFEATARRGNITRAAEDIGLTQGAVSRQVLALEAYLRVSLFDRDGGRLRLTQAGRRLVHEISPLLDGLQTSLDALRLPSEPVATVMLATYPTLAARWLVTRRLAYEARPGAAAIQVETITSNADFEEGRYDLGILQGIPPFPGLADARLMAERLVLAGSPGRAAEVSGDLAALPRGPYLRHVTRPMALHIWADRIGDLVPEPTATIDFDRYDMMIEAAIAGHGIGVFPDVLIARELRLGQLAMAHPHVAAPPAAYYVVHARDRSPGPAAAAFRDWLISTDPDA